MRIEILRSGRRRYHPSPEEKAKIVTETLAAGATVAEVARKHGITPGRILAWRREAKAKEHGEPAAPGLVKVHVVASPATAARQDVRAEELPRSAQETKRTGIIEIDLGDGRCLRVDAKVDTDALSRVLDVMRRRCSRSHLACGSGW
jgi:transposase